MAVATRVTSYVVREDETTKWTASGSVVFGSLVSNRHKDQDIKQRLLISSTHLREATQSRLVPYPRPAAHEPAVESQFEASAIELADK